MTVGFISRLFNRDKNEGKEQMQRQAAAFVSDAFSGEKKECSFCGMRNAAKDLIRGEDGSECCARCGLPDGAAPDGERLSAAMARAKVYDAFHSEMIGILFGGKEQQEERARQVRERIRERLDKNDPQDEFVIYRNARLEGKTLPIPMEGMFMPAERD